MRIPVVHRAWVEWIINRFFGDDRKAPRMRGFFFVPTRLREVAGADINQAIRGGSRCFAGDFKSSQNANFR